MKIDILKKRRLIEKNLSRKAVENKVKLFAPSHTSAVAKMCGKQQSSLKLKEVYMNQDPVGGWDFL